LLTAGAGAIFDANADKPITGTIFHADYDKQVEVDETNALNNDMGSAKAFNRNALAPTRENV
jgi:hypothetical protein